MNPFSSTPTPRRFLLPRRSTQSSSQTPGAPPQFQSTPRFGSSSAPRPTQGNELDIEESEDGEEEEVISESSLSGDERGATETRQAASRNRVLDIESDAGVPPQEEPSSGVVDSRSKSHRRFHIESESPSEGSQGTTVVGREAKRRKMSISPTPLIGSDDAPHEETAFDTEDGASVMSMDSGEGSPIIMRNSKALPQPIFQQAPRFKPLDAETAFNGLPAAFSPQRRGSRYVSGGMAAQLQGWLSEVKGWDENSGRVESAMKLHVEHVRPGRRMYLVEGRDPLTEASKRWILAGEGKLTGLGKRAEVKMESVVLIEPPVWDVELEGSIWNVACEWSVEMT